MLGIKELNYNMWQAVDEDSPVFWLKDGIKMEELYLYEVWLYNGDQTIAKYFLDSKTGIQEKIGELLEGVYKGYGVKSVNRLCAEEEISSGLWKESVISRLCDNIEGLLLNYRCYDDKVGRPLVDMLSNGELDSESGKAEIHILTDYLFKGILEEWEKDNFTEEIFEIMKDEQIQSDTTKLANYLFNWCKRIDENGGNWDEWDDYYKNAYWNKDQDIYKIVRKYIRPQE